MWIDGMNLRLPPSPPPKKNMLFNNLDANADDSFFLAKLGFHISDIPNSLSAYWTPLTSDLPQRSVTGISCKKYFKSAAKIRLMVICWILLQM